MIYKKFLYILLNIIAVFIPYERFVLITVSYRTRGYLIESNFNNFKKYFYLYGHTAIAKVKLKDNSSHIVYLYNKDEDKILNNLKNYPIINSFINNNPINPMDINYIKILGFKSDNDAYI